MKKLSTVLFDMDGVVVDSMKHHADCWINILRRYDVEVSITDIYKREGMIGVDAVRDLFVEKGKSPENKILLDIIDLKDKCFDGSRIKVYPEIEELVKLLSFHEIQIGLVTGSCYNTVQSLLASDLFGRFDCIITADDVNRGKPFPDPYLKAIDRLHADPDCTVVIENAPMGIKSAKLSKMYCMAICTTLSSPYLSDADLVFDNHELLLMYFNKHLNIVKS